jgi:hypothetical protein
MIRAWIPVAVAFIASVVACNANPDNGCEDGMCTTGSVATNAGVGGGAGCMYTKDEAGNLPCDVYTVLHDNCHRCHQSPPLNGAPFPLLTYADTQAQYYNTADKIWEHMKLVIEPGAVPGMPFGSNPPGMPEEKLNVLRAWFATCSPGPCSTFAGQGQGGAGGGSTTSSTASSTASSSTTASTSTASTGTGN